MECELSFHLPAQAWAILVKQGAGEDYGVHSVVRLNDTDTGVYVLSRLCTCCCFKTLHMPCSPSAPASPHTHIMPLYRHVGPLQFGSVLLHARCAF